MEQKELLNLILKSKAGDRSAQEQLVVAVQNKVYYHCRKFLKNEEDAQDATQDVLIAMLTNLEKLREPAAFWGWLNTITANRCKRLLTQEPKEWQIPEDEEGNSMLDSMETLDDQAIPDQALDNDETRRMVMDIIDRLPAEQRMTVVFFYYDEMSVKDIASMMEVSEGTVKSRLNYARKSIKLEVEKLEKKGTKLYSVSILPFLAYFLRMGAETQTLSPAAAAAVTQGTMAAIGAAAAEGAAGTTGAAATAAAGAKVGGTVSVKLIAAVLAGVLAAGGIGAAVYLLSHPDSEPAAELVDEPAADVTPDLTPEPAPEDILEPAAPPRPYADAYIAKVLELSEQLGEDARYSLVYIDEDSTPELVAGTEYSINLYTVASDGELCILQEDWVMGRLGLPTYYPGQNAVLTQYSMMAGGDHQELGYTCYRIDEEYQFQEYFQDSGEFWGNDDARSHFPTLPEELAGLESEVLGGDLTAQEILELLGYTSKEPAADMEPTLENFDFSPYAGIYSVIGYSDLYGTLTLHDDGTLTANEAFYTHHGISDGYISSTNPTRLNYARYNGSEEEVYTLWLIEPQAGSIVSEYYVLYPPGVADDRGGSIDIPRILYVNNDASGAYRSFFLLKISDTAKPEPDTGGGTADFDFSPYVGTYTADPRSEAIYSCDALDLILNSDGSLSGGGATYSWSNTVSSTPTGTAPIELRTGREGHGGEGSYTLILRQMEFEMEGRSGFTEEYYILYPPGVADSKGGDSAAARIYYVDATGGVWDMFYIKK